MKKRQLLALITSVVLTATMLMGCGQSSTGSSTTTKNKVAKVAVIIKATDSDYWQYVLLGANNYAKDHSDKVQVKTYGPPSEADIDKQVAILENVIEQKPDAIVIASTSSDATVPSIEKAVAAGIKVITVDNKVNTDKISSFLATDNLKGGALCADKMVEKMKANNIPLKGKVGVVSAMAGVQVLTDRDNGFIKRLKEIAPDLQPIATKYVDNDIMKALSTSEDILTANTNVVGFFGDNNHAGDGVSRAIKERGMSSKIAAVSYDSDPEEVQSLKDGNLYALILQDPYGMGYKGVDSALKALAGDTLPKYVDTGVTAVTKANMDKAEVKALLDPTTLKKK